MQSLRRRGFLLIEVLSNRRCSLCLSAVAGFVFFGFPVLAKADQRDLIVLARQVDPHIAAQWDAQKVKPTFAADNSTFVRRV